MATIQIVLDPKLLKAADRVARLRKVNRSALIREALQQHLERLHMAELEDAERRAYAAVPQRQEEYAPWEDIASWPED